MVRRSEKDTILRAADRAGTTLSEWVRQTLLDAAGESGVGA